MLASDCPAPDRSAALCEELRSWGVASLLEVRDFIDPIAQRVHASLWCFKSPLNELDAVSSFEQQVIRDFVRYELARTRSVALWAENDAVRDAVVSEAVAEPRRDTSSRSLNPNPPKDVLGDSP